MFSTYCLHSLSPLNLHGNLSKKIHMTSASQMRQNHKNAHHIRSHLRKMHITSAKVHITSSHIHKMNIKSAHIHKSAHHITKMHIPYTHIHENAHHIRSHSQKAHHIRSHLRKMHITSAKVHITSSHIHKMHITPPLTSTKVHITSLKGTFHTRTFTKIHITAAHIHKIAHHILFTAAHRHGRIMLAIALYLHYNCMRAYSIAKFLITFIYTAFAASEHCSIMTQCIARICDVQVE
jgi:hypothetical protein